MNFDKENIETPTGIGNIKVELRSTLDSNGVAEFELQILNQDGVVMSNRGGDLLPHLTTQEKTQLSAFMDTLRARAIDKIIEGN